MEWLAIPPNVMKGPIMTLNVMMGPFMTFNVREGPLILGRGG